MLICGYRTNNQNLGIPKKAKSNQNGPNSNFGCAAVEWTCMGSRGLLQQEGMIPKLGVKLYFLDMMFRRLVL